MFDVPGRRLQGQDKEAIIVISLQLSCPIKSLIAVSELRWVIGDN